MNTYNTLSQALIIAQKDVREIVKAYSVIATMEERTKPGTVLSHSMGITLQFVSNLHTDLLAIKAQARKDVDDFLAANPPIPVLSPRERMIAEQDADI